MAGEMNFGLLNRDAPAEAALAPVKGMGAVNALISQDLQNQASQFEMQNALAEQQAYKQAGGDAAVAQKSLMNAGLGKQSIALGQAQAKTNLDQMKALSERLPMQREMAKSMALDPSPRNIMTNLDYQVKMGWMTPQQAQATVQNLQNKSPEELTAYFTNSATKAEDFAKYLEDVRSNKVREGQAQQQIGISAGNLAETRRGHDLQYGRDVVANTVTDEKGNVTQFNRYGQVIGTPGKVGKSSGPTAKSIESIDQQLATVQGALDAVKSSPDAFGFSRGVLGETIGGRMGTEQEIADRSYLFNTISGVIKERAGTAQSSGERATLNRFLPLPTDNAEIITGKLKAFDKYLNDRKTALTGEKPKAPKEPAVNIPQGAVDALKSGKGTREQFDQIFGAGAADKVLGKGK